MKQMNHDLGLFYELEK